MIYSLPRRIRKPLGSEEDQAQPILCSLNAVASSKDQLVTPSGMRPASFGHLDPLDICSRKRENATAYQDTPGEWPSLP